jgi:hypothetical protein
LDDILPVEDENKKFLDMFGCKTFELEKKKEMSIEKAENKCT